MEENFTALNESELMEVAGGAKTITCTEYIVKKGDTLTHLAKKFGTTVDMLVKINNIEDKNLIKIGQKLLIPVKK